MLLTSNSSYIHEYFMYACPDIYEYVIYISESTEYVIYISESTEYVIYQ